MMLLLASQSPRRKILMEEAGYEFTAIPSDFEEYFDESRPASEIACELGLGKAKAVATLHPEAYVIGSDLIVVVDGRQIGKPEDEAEAKAMLRMLSGRSHQLIASVAVVCIDKQYEKVGYETAEVEFDELSDEFIDEYVATGTTYDKAGGYAIQHPMMAPHVRILSGREDTIIGMPMNLVDEFLKKCK